MTTGNDDASMKDNPAKMGESAATGAWVRTAIVVASTAILGAIGGALAGSGLSGTPSNASIPRMSVPVPAPVHELPNLTMPEVRQVAREEAKQVVDERLQGTLNRIESKVDSLVTDVSTMKTDIQILKVVKKNK